ncbi:hypothetical protein SAMN05216369_1314 [Marinobacter antarcticus]|uniref:Uncharacterized protein n=1 Tax=Marinobacter antarcticus TaxID=564117 RepID=A0A1M6R565_9GAMM|nr:hypothetical protein SAMN05216369_1314 [Marinobacter antarcticus]
MKFLVVGIIVVVVGFLIWRSKQNTDPAEPFQIPVGISIDGPHVFQAGSAPCSGRGLNRRAGAYR